MARGADPASQWIPARSGRIAITEAVRIKIQKAAILVHDNERRWRVTRKRTEQLVHAMTAGAGQAPTTGEGAAAGETGPSA